jgi:hypothetical protein
MFLSLYQRQDLVDFGASNFTARRLSSYDAAPLPLDSLRFQPS